jgi:ABC-2 type transport system ATP-binding protein
MSAYISIQNLTKDYGEGRGIFNISIDIEKGQTIGIVGINGAGKTTLLRCLMGFLKPTNGGAKINNLDC